MSYLLCLSVMSYLPMSGYVKLQPITYYLLLITYYLLLNTYYLIRITYAANKINVFLASYNCS